MKLIKILFCLMFLIKSINCTEEEKKGYTINFKNVSMLELVKFASKIAKVNFVFDEKLLNFNITLISSKPIYQENIIDFLSQLLMRKGIKIKQQKDYFIIEKMSEEDTLNKDFISSLDSENLLKPINKKNTKDDFYIYKLQYNQGSEIQNAIKDISKDTKIDDNFFKTTASIQWLKSTNSLLYSGDKNSIDKVTNLVKRLDVPLKQVFIEVLVIETDVKNGLEFGLQWGGGGKISDKIGFGGGNFDPSIKTNPFANTLKQINEKNTPTGTNQFPIGSGFDLGVIGDLILHKGKTFFSLGSLVSAIQANGNSTIILNQKIITQDNKQSKIFVGDNIPFTGSVVETIGPSQQTTSNIEYKDIGVSLNITPMFGEDEIITLELSEEITEATNKIINPKSPVNGIQTTKTNMLTRVHIPDRSFLVLSGMIRNAKTNQKVGLPCLGAIPFMGAAFSKTKTDNEKRNIIVFVRPQIINSSRDFEKITETQTEIHKKQAGDKVYFENGLNSTN